jgi:hypothetical protein
MLQRTALAALVFFVSITSAAAQEPSMTQVIERLEAVERQNRHLTRQVEELSRQLQTAQAAAAAPAAQVANTAPAAPATPSTSADPGSPRISFNGDLRFRHDHLDNSLLANERTRQTVRARFNAAIALSDSIKGEVGFATGNGDPRGGSATLGSASSKKDVDVDLLYLSWRAMEQLTLTAGKMREPYTRPGRSLFFDNEIRPEGVAVSYKDARGIFGTAFDFWLEERALQGDSKLRGAQVGWDGSVGAIKLKTGGGYYDYHDVQGRFPGFGNGLVNEAGNTVIGAGPGARFAYDYDVGQLFAEVTLPIAGIPLNLFADFARNFDAGNDLDDAYDIGFLVGKAAKPGQWEAGMLHQRMEKDALFGQWTDSDFSGGVTDNSGEAYRLAWMAVRNLVINLTYYDSQFNVDVGPRADYRRWQLDFNLIY